MIRFISEAWPREDLGPLFDIINQDFHAEPLVRVDLHCRTYHCARGFPVVLSFQEISQPLDHVLQLINVSTGISPPAEPLSPMSICLPLGDH